MTSAGAQAADKSQSRKLMSSGARTQTVPGKAPTPACQTRKPPRQTRQGARSRRSRSTGAPSGRSVTLSTLVPCVAPRHHKLLPTVFLNYLAGYRGRLMVSKSFFGCANLGITKSCSKTFYLSLSKPRIRRIFDLFSIRFGRLGSRGSRLVQVKLIRILSLNLERQPAMPNVICSKKCGK